ncbi:MAG: glycerol-3-phosphate responsive antiterminator [Mahellales bacterium]|jgi:glycerol uptake operon antiterminator
MGIISKLEDNPVIATIRDWSGLKRAVLSPVNVIFILDAHVCDMHDMVKAVKDSGKNVFLHIDLVQGLSKDSAALDFIISRDKPDGVITTKSSLVRHAINNGMMVIQRLFLVDSQSLETGMKVVETMQPHMVEIMPGLIDKATRILKKRLKQPIIAGGMITEKNDVIQALKSGAFAVSTSIESLWYT